MSSAQPLIVSYGVGVDSTAVLVGLAQRGIRPDVILFADTKAEKDETYGYLEHINPWLDKVGFPRVTVLEYTVKDFKNWPPYFGLEENCLTNGTLPSEAFGMGSCSEKWKQQPQNKWARTWEPAVQAWARGEKVRKAIGYDDSPADQKRSCKADRTFKVKPDARYDYWYPLQEWHWDRARCIREIREAGLPVPLKSSCFFCPNMKMPEIDQLPAEKLARIVILEARAKVRLEGHMSQEDLDAKYQAQLAAWTKKSEKARQEGLPLPRAPKQKTAGGKQLMRGLWRNRMITDYIREKGLLGGQVIDRLARQVPTQIVRRAEAHARGERVESWGEFMGRVLVDLA